MIRLPVINGQVYDDAREPTALGGITNGVSTLELTAAYATIANGGTYTKPVFYTKILDQNGDVVLENKPQTTEVFRESTAYLLTSALESVVNDEGGTGNGLQLDNKPVRQVQPLQPVMCGLQDLPHIIPARYGQVMTPTNFWKMTANRSTKHCGKRL